MQIASSGAQGFSKVVKITNVAAISNRALSSAVRTRLGNRGYICDFGKVLIWRETGSLGTQGADKA
jgi:hypothetical protein